MANAVPLTLLSRGRIANEVNRAEQCIIILC